MNPILSSIKGKALSNRVLTREEAQCVLECPDSDLIELLAAAKRVREAYFGTQVKLSFLVNVKSGLCSEDCGYCAQSKISQAPINKYALMSSDAILAHVERGLKMGATRTCLVASGRGPGERELAGFCEAVTKIKEKYPTLEVCASLGFLKVDQVENLKNSGITIYNHNINTSASFYKKICATHSYDDRLDTIKKIKSKGLCSCSGVLTGMGETNRDLVEMALSLREQHVNTIPVNFLMPIPGTRLEGMDCLTPQRCLKILALFRFVNPTVELRIAGGREVHLRHLQPLGLMVANAIFIGDYLTTRGQSPIQDLEMIRDLGYHIEGQSGDFIDSVLRNQSLSFKLRLSSCKGGANHVPKHKTLNA